MTITQITWRQFGAPGDRVKGVASIVLDDELVIHEVRVIVGHSRLFVSYPNKEYDTHDQTGCVYPINDTTRREWEREILTSFVKAMTLHEQEQPPLPEEPPAAV